jgi:hypothetical protein
MEPGVDHTKSDAAQKAHEKYKHHAEQLAAEAQSRPYTYPSASTAAFIPPSSYMPRNDQKIEIHRLLQTRSTLGIARMPELVFDMRYDPKHAFDRSAAGGDDNAYWSGGASGGRKGKGGGTDLATAPAFMPGQAFVRLVIRHPFNGKSGDWVEDIDEANYMTVIDVINIISEMVHKNIDQVRPFSLPTRIHSHLYSVETRLGTTLRSRPRIRVRSVPEPPVSRRRSNRSTPPFILRQVHVWRDRAAAGESKGHDGRGTEFLGQVDQKWVVSFIFFARISR